MVASRLNESHWEFIATHEADIRQAVQRAVKCRPDVLSRHGFDDLLQEARAAVCAALATYIPGASKPTLNSYVFGCVKFALLRYAAQSHREFSTPEDVVDERELVSPSHPILDNLLSRLSKGQRRLIELRYGLKGNRPHSTRETAALLQEPEATVRYRQGRIEAIMAELAMELPPAP